MIGIPQDFANLKKDLDTLQANFEFLSTLQPGENLQPTSLGRTYSRKMFGFQENVIQKTFNEGLGLYSKMTNAYGQDSFDEVIKHYRSEIHKARQIFDDTLITIANFNQIECPPKFKIELLESAKSAFWHMAASRIGLHEWAKHLKLTFKDDCKAWDHRSTQINGLIAQENSILKKIFKECLYQFPNAAYALKGQIEDIHPIQKSSPRNNNPPLTIKCDKKTFFEVAQELGKQMLDLSAILKNNLNLSIDEIHEKNKKFLIMASKEFLNVTKNFVTKLEKYEEELLSQAENIHFQESLQIEAYRSLLSHAAVIKGCLPENLDNLDDVGEAIDLLHTLFIEGTGSQEGIAFIAEMISATIDINFETRSQINHVIDAENQDLFPETKTALWQLLAYQLITSRFAMPIKEMLALARAIPQMHEYEDKLQNLLDFFKVAADLANKSVK